MDTNKGYCSFFISLKRVQTNDLPTWIVALRNVQTGQQQIFSNLEGLLQFLQSEFGRDVEQQASRASVTQDFLGPVP